MPSRHTGKVSVRHVYHTGVLTLLPQAKAMTVAAILETTLALTSELSAAMLRSGRWVIDNVVDGLLGHVVVY